MTTTPAEELTLGRRFLRLAVPNMLSNLLVPLGGLVDMAILGHLDNIRHLAGVALGAVIFDYVYWSFGFLRMGTTGLVAQAHGRLDRDEALRAFLRGGAIALFFGLLILVLQSSLRDLGFNLLSGTAEVENSGRAYFDARVWGAPAVLVNLVMLGWLLGRERVKQALILAAVGNATNIGLDYLFIVRMGLEAAGAGWATAISQYAMLATGLAISWQELGPTHLRAAARGLAERAAIVRMFVLNGDILVRTLALVSVFAVFTNVASTMGTLILAVTAVLRGIQNFAAYFIDGLAYATESLAGIYRGSLRPREMVRLLGLASLASLALGLMIALAIGLLPRPLLGLLTDHAEVLDELERFAWWMLPVLGFGSLAFALDGYFIGLTAGRILSVAMLVAVAVGFVPLAVLASSREDPHLLWLAMAVFMLARVITLAVMVPRTIRQAQKEGGPIPAP